MAIIEIRPTEDLSEQRKRDEKFQKENEDYRRATENLRFKKGHKLLLEVEVTDEFLSENLFMLLHDKVPGQENLGFRINTMNFNNLDNNKQRIIDKLEQFVQELKSGY